MPTRPITISNTTIHTTNPHAEAVIALARAVEALGLALQKAADMSKGTHSVGIQIDGDTHNHFPKPSTEGKKKP